MGRPVAPDRDPVNPPRPPTTIICGPGRRVLRVPQQRRPGPVPHHAPPDGHVGVLVTATRRHRLRQFVIATHLPPVDSGG